MKHRSPNEPTGSDRLATLAAEQQRRAEMVRNWVFCNGCKAQRDRRRPCPRGCR